MTSPKINTVPYSDEPVREDEHPDVTGHGIQPDDTDEKTETTATVARTGTSVTTATDDSDTDESPAKRRK